MIVLWRMQRADGRGPWIKGLANEWADDRDVDLPPFYVELGWDLRDIRRHLPPDMHIGCACSSQAQLHHWFSRPERRRLSRLGFGTVVFVPDLIIAETPNQVLFANRAPLSVLRPNPSPVAADV